MKEAGVKGNVYREKGYEPVKAPAPCKQGKPNASVTKGGDLRTKGKKK